MLNVLADVSQILGFLLSLFAVWAAIYPEHARRLAPRAARRLGYWRSKIDGSFFRLSRRLGRLVTESLTALAVIAVVGLSVFLLLVSGAGLPQEFRDLLAPLAAMLIGVAGLRYVVGQDRSLAAFLGFLLLGLGDYALIRWGPDFVRILG